jgi:hypothetical protein
MSTPRDPGPRRWQPPVTATPQAVALHRNFLNAMEGLRRELVRSMFYLQIIGERKVYRTLGFASIYDYAARTVGLSKDQTKAFLRLGARLSELPLMQKALSDGSISWRKADILVGEADRDCEASLIEAAKELSEVELKDFLEGEKRPSPGADAGGCRPDHTRPRSGKRRRPVLPETLPPSSLLRPAHETQHVLFKLTPEQYTRWAGLLARLKINKEDALIQGLEALVAGDGTGAGDGYLLIIQQCPVCETARLQNTRGSFEAPPALLAAARCDGIIEDEETTRRRRIVPPRVRRKVLKRDDYRCTAQGCSHTNSLEMHHRAPTSHGGRSTEDNLVTLCLQCHRRLHEEEENLREANRGPGV